MLCRFTPSARPTPTSGQGELAGRAQVSVSGRSPVLACFLGQCWDYGPEPWTLLWCWPSLELPLGGADEWKQSSQGFLP